MADTNNLTLKAVGLSGSPSPNSRSKILLAKTLDMLAAYGTETQLIDLAELPADGLLMRRPDALIDAAILQTSQANIIVVSTPVYRATYTGQLKVFFDLLPQDALRGLVVGMIATGVFAREVGLIAGESRMFLLQLAALAIAGTYTFAGSYLLYKVTDAIIPMRVPEEQERVGLDLSQHGESLILTDDVAT